MLTLLVAVLLFAEVCKGFVSPKIRSSSNSMNIVSKNHGILRSDARTELNMAFNFFGKSSPAKKSKSKKLVVVTGTSSGLGKFTAIDLLKKGDYFVVCGVRDVEKMKAVAQQYNFDSSSYSILPLDLNSFDSTRNFYKKVKSLGKGPVERLVCNAAVYQPALDKVRNFHSSPIPSIHTPSSNLYFFHSRHSLNTHPTRSKSSYRSII
jgi:hypothetical protein